MSENEASVWGRIDALAARWLSEIDTEGGDHQSVAAEIESFGHGTYAGGVVAVVGDKIVMMEWTHADGFQVYVPTNATALAHQN